MTTQQTQATAAEIRQAVAFGKQAVIRELTDALARLRREHFDAPRDVVDEGSYRRGRAAAHDAAAALVRSYQIEGEPKR